jgi:hypothetical protein
LDVDVRGACALSWKVRPALRPSDDSTNVYIFVCLVVIISAAVNRGYHHLPPASHDHTLGTDIRKKNAGAKLLVYINSPKG